MAPGSPMQEVQVPTWGTNVGAVNDEEAKTMSRNRQYGYAIMACAVVALAVLMVSSVTFRDRYYPFFFLHFIQSDLVVVGNWPSSKLQFQHH